MIPIPMNLAAPLLLAGAHAQVRMQLVQVKVMNQVVLLIHSSMAALVLMIAILALALIMTVPAMVLMAHLVLVPHLALV